MAAPVQRQLLGPSPGLRHECTATMRLDSALAVTCSMRASQLGCLYYWPRWLGRRIAGQDVDDVGEGRRLVNVLRTLCGRANPQRGKSVRRIR